MRVVFLLCYLWGENGRGASQEGNKKEAFPALWCHGAEGSEIALEETDFPAVGGIRCGPAGS